jgi:hypothetical protein
VRGRSIRHREHLAVPVFVFFFGGALQFQKRFGRQTGCRQARHRLPIIARAEGLYGTGRYDGVMRSFILAGTMALLAFCVTLHAALLPTLQLDKATIKAFDDYVAQYEKTVYVQFSASGKIWIDDDPKKSVFDAGKPVVEPRENQDVANGSIHHFTGALHINGGTIAQVNRVMQDYQNYPAYFRPDLGRASGELLPDSSPNDQHYRGYLQLTQTTFWMEVIFDTVYDTHYRLLDKNRWTSRSAAISIREMVDAKNPASGFFPEGNDHGLLWRTNTYWYGRERNGGIDLAVDSISLSRPNVSGLAWWGTKRSHDAVEKMLRDIRAAIEPRR